MYKRNLEEKIKSHFFKGKIIVLYGPRQVGKTTLSKKIVLEMAEKYKIPYKYIQADVSLEREAFSEVSPEKIKKYFGDAKIVLIDEAQYIKNIGLILKTFIDKYPEIQIIATGSASFELAAQIKEPMTGRVFEYFMYPLSVSEVMDGNMFDYKSKEDFYMRFGLYPGVVNIGESEAVKALQMMQESYLYKDILIFENLKRSDILDKMIKFLAFNVGTVVNTNNISREIGTTSKTVDRYIDLLQKMFVLKKIYAYSRNPINEIKKGYKIYFYDVGMRNSIISNHNRLDIRDDIGAIFENFFIMEKLKYNAANDIYANIYFWQNYQGLEVDLIEEYNGKLYAYECKYKDRKSRGLKVFAEQYKNTVENIVTKDNYLDFVL